MSSSKRTLLVVGSGPGIGTTTASLFARHGFTQIGLISRNAERLQQDVSTVRKATSQPGLQIKTYPADTGSVDQLRGALANFHDELGAPEVVLFNAARIAESTIGQDGPEVLLQDFQMMNVGLYVVATWATPLLISRAEEKLGRPSFLLSGGAVHEDPLPEVFSLCMQKAAQHNLMKSLDKQFGAQGVHFGVVNIGGPVTDEDPVINVKNISETFWELAQEEKGKWRHSVDIGVKR